MIKEFGYDEKTTLDLINGPRTGDELSDEEKMIIANLGLFKILINLDPLSSTIYTSIIENLTGLEFETDKDFVLYVGKAINDPKKYGKMVATISKRINIVQSIEDLIESVTESMPKTNQDNTEEHN